MTIIQAKSENDLTLGRQGENLARQVVFDLSAWEAEYGPGTVELIHQRPGDTSPYPVAAVREGSTLVWTLTATDTAVASSYGSDGHCELRYYVGEVLVKSRTWLTKVIRAMSTPSETAPPEPEQGWVDQVLAAGAAAMTAADAAKADADRAASLAEEVSKKAAQTAQDASDAAKAMEAAQIAQRLAEEAQSAAEAARTAAAAAQAAAETAATDAAGAKQGAETAQKAAQDAAAAAAKALADIRALYQEMQTWAQGVIQDVNDAGSAAVQSVQSAGDTQVQRVTDEGTTQTANAKAQADAAAQSASEAAQSAQQAAESASVYDTVVADVTQLKQDVAAITPDDAAVNGKPWTSKKTVDSLCMPFEESGNPVQVYPVENYPLGVKVSWEPTQEGEGDPSPENIRQISGRDAVQVTRCGKNLSETNAFGGITWASQNKSIDKLVNSLPAGTYKISFTITLNEFSDRFTSETAEAKGLYAYYTVYDGSASYGRQHLLGDMQSIYRTDMLPKSANVSANIVIAEKDTGYKKTINFYGCGRNTYADGAPNGALGTAEVSNLQIELGYTATDYEPYTGSTTDIALPETVYGGTLDWNTGLLMVDRARVTLKGDEMSHIYAGMLYLSIGKQHNPKDSISGKCSHYRYFLYAKGEIGITNDGKSAVYKPDGDYTGDEDGLNEWKAYLAAQYAAGTPVQIVYEILNPYTIQLTPQQIAALSGVNTLYTDADGVIVTGAEDPKHTITELKNAIISLGGNV